MFKTQKNINFGSLFKMNNNEKPNELRNYDSKLIDSGHKSQYGEEDPPYQATKSHAQSEVDFPKGGVNQINVLQGQKQMKREGRINSVVSGV